MSSIRIAGVEKRFGSLLALSDINLEIAKGEFFTLLGPSGCGKTTLLRTIAGFYRQDKGDIWLGDELINDVPAYKRNTGMVFQNYAVFPHMTVRENVAYGLKVRKLPQKEIEAKVAQSLRNVHLEGYEDRTPDKLSGGQQQRVGLARAMAIEPRVLLFDEPLSNLDAKLRVEMRDEIRAVQKSLGITAVYVTHDQEEALVISDRIAVVNFGKIQQVGQPWAIYKNPVNLFVATFVGKINKLEVKLGESAGAGLRKAHCGNATFVVPSRGTDGMETAMLAFRPEDVVEEGGCNDVATLLEGKLLSTSFLGAVASLEVDLLGTMVVIERHRPGDIPESGVNVKFAVPPEACLLFDTKTGERVGGGAR